MEVTSVGKVVVPASIVNLWDVRKAEEGLLDANLVRSTDVDDAVVDTGATLLSMPARLISQLGLSRIRSRTARTTAGVHTFAIYGPARITVQGRECLVEAAEIPDNCPVLIGQVPLELLDFVVDPKGRKLIGNPEHGGEQMIEMF